LRLECVDEKNSASVRHMQNGWTQRKSGFGQTLCDQLRNKSGKMVWSIHRRAVEKVTILKLNVLCVCIYILHYIKTDPFCSCFMSGFQSC
jgi:hypothetical protein